jgi:hypothetical protein
MLSTFQRESKQTGLLSESGRELRYSAGSIDELFMVLSEAYRYLFDSVVGF